MGSTLVDETDAYKVWFRRASDAVGGAISPEELWKRYQEGMAQYNATIAGHLKPFGYQHERTGHMYPSELDRAYPEAKPLLEKLSKTYKIGVIANQSRGAAERLESYGLLPYIDFVLGSAEAGLVKPDPRIFRLALEKAGCRPREAVMIGDRPDNDIYPAKRLGLRTIRIRQGTSCTQLPKSLAYEADATVHSLDELYEVLVR
ncbi:MAG: HAD family hydrolase [Clostridiales bacterium]|nr:HAD family hydrolase [Clostridiales bacterium]